MLAYKILPAGDTAVVVEFGETIDPRINAWVLALARRLNEAALAGLVETVPTFRSLLVQYEPLVLSADALVAHIDQLMRGLRVAETAGRAWRIPVCYDAALAPDLDAVAARTGLSPAQVIERHSGQTYHVYMLGFLPGQAYLGDLPDALALTRRETPRSRIPAGSVAIAATMTCVFPLETPCGWHLIGRSPVPLWRHGTQAGALLAPGDEVRFTPVSQREFDRLASETADGTLTITPTNRALGAAA